MFTKEDKINMAIVFILGLGFGAYFIISQWEPDATA